MRRTAPRRPRRGLVRPGVGAVIAAAVALALTGCTAEGSGVDGSAATPTSTASIAPSLAPTPTATPAPTFRPDGSAEDNLSYFTQVVDGVWASPDALSTEAYVTALAAAGFDREAMQATSDTTTIGQPAESIQVAVAWRDACLVGQVGPATGDPVATVLPLLADGGCLVGRTADLGG